MTPEFEVTTGLHGEFQASQGYRVDSGTAKAT